MDGFARSQRWQGLQVQHPGSGGGLREDVYVLRAARLQGEPAGALRGPAATHDLQLGEAFGRMAGRPRDVGAWRDVIWSSRDGVGLASGAIVISDVVSVPFFRAGSGLLRRLLALGHLVAAPGFAENVGLQ